MRARSYRLLAAVVLITAASAWLKTRHARDEIAGVPGAPAQHRPFMASPVVRSQSAPAQEAAPHDSPAGAAEVSDARSVLARIRKWVDGHAVLNRDAEGEFLALYSNIEMSPEIVAYADELATRADPGQRRLGFLLLKRATNPGPEARGVLVQSLTTEQDPTVLSQAIRAVGLAVFPPDETAGVVVPLRYLAAHADAAVRAASVDALARWDAPAAAEAAVYAGLKDPARDVRLAAVTAVAESGLNSERLKSALLSMARDPNESVAVKAGALATLIGRFTLTSDEAANYRGGRQELAALPKGGEFAP